MRGNKTLAWALYCHMQGHRRSKAARWHVIAIDLSATPILPKAPAASLPLANHTELYHHMTNVGARGAFVMWR